MSERGLDKATSERLKQIKQMMWDAYRILGFDTDGDETPDACVGWPNGFLAAVREVRSAAESAEREAQAQRERADRLEREVRQERERTERYARAKQRIATLTRERDEAQQRLADACSATGTTDHPNPAECVAQIKNTLKAQRERADRLEAALRDIRDNFDCDEDSHRLGTHCRCCVARAALAAQPAGK